VQLRFIPSTKQVLPANATRQEEIRYYPHSNLPPPRVYNFYIMKSKEPKFKQGMPVINPFICDENVKSQDQCVLLSDKLPTQSFDAIVKLATHSSADQILLALACKKMAAKVFQTYDQPLLRAEVPRALRPNDASTYVTKCLDFLKQLDEWISEEKGWRHSISCAKFKRVTGGGLGAGTEEWRSLKRKRDDDDIGICPKHCIDNATKVYHMFKRRR
jgi:hypothetical protein